MGVGFHIETAELFDGDTHTFTYLISEEAALKNKRFLQTSNIF